MSSDPSRNEPDVRLRDGYPRPISKGAVPPQRYTGRVRLDWVAYFREFCTAHGMYPVLNRGRLLFPDGYQYSATDYKGPEWYPPDDPAELRMLQREYWTRRREIVEGERKDAAHSLKQLEELANVRSVPLQVAGIEQDDEGRYQRVVRAVDFAGLRARLAWLEGDAVECDNQLSRLKEPE